MDKNLIVLAILNAFNQRAQPSDLSLVKALLSCLLNETFDSQKLENVVLSLAEMGYVSLGEPAAQVTPKGIAIAETLARTSLNRYDLEFIDKNVERFLAGSPKARERQTAELMELVNKQTLFLGRRIERISSEKYLSNAVKLSIDLKSDRLFENKFDSSHIKSLRNSSDRFRVFALVERVVESEIGKQVIVKPGTEGFIVYAPISVETVSTNELNFRRSGEAVERTMEDIPDVLRALVFKSLNRRFREKGFSRAGAGRRFVDFSRHDALTSELGLLRVFKGFSFKLDFLETGGVAWFDPTTKVTLTVLDYLEHLRQQGLGMHEIGDEIMGKSVRVFPSDSMGEVVGISESPLSMASEKVPGTTYAYASYWRDRHQLKLTRETQHTVEVALGESRYSYPSEALYFDKVELETLSKVPLDLERTLLSPIDRVKSTEQLLRNLLDAPINEQFFQLTFSSRLLNWADLEKERYCSPLSRLSPPNLRFAVNKQLSEMSNDPRSIFKYGPYSGEKNAKIPVVLTPSSESIESIRSFFEFLIPSYQRLGFGNLKFDSGSVYRYSSSIPKSRLGNLLETISSMSSDPSIAIVVLPQDRFDLYLPFKEQIFRRLAIPVQVIFSTTFQRIASGEVGPTRGLMLQIYTKLLKKNEAAWILADPADDHNESMYVGIGFSATPYSEMRANSFAAMCDSKGGEIDWKPIGVPFTGRYIDESWFTGFLKFVSENTRLGVKRIVVFRRGETYPSEIEAMRGVVSQIADRPFEDFNFVSVINEERRMISVHDGPQNPESGVFARLNSGEAMLVCSLQHAVTLRQGTAVPVRLTRCIGNSHIERIVREYLALTYLNWAAPVSASKYPLVLNIANRIAQLVKEQSDLKMLEAYLPL